MQLLSFFDIKIPTVFVLSVHLLIEAQDIFLRVLKRTDLKKLPFIIDLTLDIEVIPGFVLTVLLAKVLLLDNKLAVQEVHFSLFLVVLVVAMLTVVFMHVPLVINRL